MSQTSSPEGQGQRQHPRYAVELDATIVHGTTSVDGRTRDLSKGGFCMHASEPIAVGTECEVRLALVFAKDQFSEHLTLPSMVVWCTALGGGYQIGVKFVQHNPENRSYLEMFIAFLEQGKEDDSPPTDDEGAFR